VSSETRKKGGLKAATTLLNLRPVLNVVAGFSPRQIQRTARTADAMPAERFSDFPTGTREYC